MKAYRIQEFLVWVTAGSDNREGGCEESGGRCWVGLWAKGKGGEREAGFGDSGKEQRVKLRLFERRQRRRRHEVKGKKGGSINWRRREHRVQDC